MTFYYQSISEIGIIFAIIVAIIGFIVSGVKRIYCKGKNDTILNERVKLLEDWKSSHLKEYQHLLEVNDEIKEGLSEVGRKIAYLSGLLDKKES